MIKAFVFGKFLPFHKGHEAMIRFALTRCDFLTVLVCCSDKEATSATVRKSWIEKTFNQQNNLEVRIYNYLERDLPNTSASSQVVSKLWSEVFRKQFPGYSLVITSEMYGDYVAEFMGIQHIAFDIAKLKFPVSGTLIRKDMFAYWNMLPDVVKPDLGIRIVVLGTESTGKTTLTEKLSRHYKCNCVTEAGRDIIANSNSFAFEDLYLIAGEHARRVNEAVSGESPIVIIDTDIHITKSYARFIFDMDLDVCEDIYNSNKADLYLYLNNDVPYFQDGTRLNETARNLLDTFHRDVLKAHAIEFVEIKGDWAERWESAVKAIDKLISLPEQKNT